MSSVNFRGGAAQVNFHQSHSRKHSTKVVDQLQLQIHHSVATYYMCISKKVSDWILKIICHPKNLYLYEDSVKIFYLSNVYTGFSIISVIIEKFGSKWTHISHQNKLINFYFLCFCIKYVFVYFQILKTDIILEFRNPESKIKG